MSLREDILWAKGLDDDAPLPENTKLMVNYVSPEWLMISEAAEWIDRTRKNADRHAIIATYIYAK
jgi:hypothetical protein